MFDFRTEQHGGKSAAEGLDPWQAEKMIAFVEHRLGITAAQRQAWERFAETVRDSVDAMGIARNSIRDGEPGALQRLAGFEVVAETASAALRRIRPAMESLYFALDVAQQKALDDLFGHRAPETHGTRH